MVPQIIGGAEREWSREVDGRESARERVKRRTLTWRELKVKDRVENPPRKRRGRFWQRLLALRCTIVHYRSCDHVKWCTIVHVPDFYSKSLVEKLHLVRVIIL